jgi:ABC-type antimicrobial peptide transport system permease subunit
LRRRGRAVLTVLALTLSGTAFLAIATATSSLDAQVARRYNAYHFDVQVNQIAGTPAPDARFRARLLALPNIRRIERWGTLQVHTEWGNIDLSGVEQQSRLYRPSLLSGRWFHPGERGAVLLSDAAAQRTGLTIGDTITLSAQGQAVTWRVIGIIRDPNVSLGSLGSAIATASDLNRLIGLAPDVGVEWMIQARDRSPAAINHLATLLAARLGGSNQFTVSTAAQVIARAQQEFSDLYTMFYAVAFVIALVGILGLYNTLTASVLERRREIGMLRAMGASGWRVGQVFWSEGLALGGIAWLAGGVIGLPLAYLFVHAFGQWVMPVDFVIDPVAFVVMLVAVVAIATLATLTPASRASQIRIAEMLRYE